MYEICLFCDCSLQLSRVTGIVLMQWSLHIHPEHRKNSHSAGQTELMWVQNGPLVFEKVLKTTTYWLRNNNFLSGDFIVQTEELVEIVEL